LDVASSHTTVSGVHLGSLGPDSSRGAQVLTSLFGQLAFTDHTHDARGLPPRSFSSFAAAAEEAAISRLYGGIHFRAAIERGLEQGACIGKHVTALA
jgi:hypothetical protein